MENGNKVLGQLYLQCCTEDYSNLLRSQYLIPLCVR